MTYSSALSLSRGQYAQAAHTAPLRNRQTYAGRNQNVVSFARAERKLGPISNTIILVVLVCLLGLLYLTQVTKTNTFGYQINSLQHKQAQLQAEHDDLTLASAQLQSLDRVQHSSTAGSLVAVAPSGTVQN